MRAARLTVIGFLALSLCLPLAALGQDADVGGPDESVEIFDFDPTYFLYVISGESAQFDGDTLTLVDAPSVLYFSDRPRRVTGHMDPAFWVETWDQGPDSFAEIPPNAVLVGGAPVTHEIVVELLDAAVEGDDLHFRIEVLDGDLPTEALAPASLFIDSADPDATILMWMYVNLDPSMAARVRKSLESHGVDLRWSPEEFPCELWLDEGFQKGVHSAMGDYFTDFGHWLGVHERCEVDP